MNSFKIKIANHVLEIVSPYKISKRYLKDFLSNEAPDVQIEISNDDVMEKKYIQGNDLVIKGWQGTIDSSLILQKISEELFAFDVLLVHGAAISLNDEAFIFIAPSGTGKTTHIQKWLENCKHAFVINGDKPFIKVNPDSPPLVYGSPWAGKENLYKNTVTPLHSIIVMERGENNSIWQISSAEAFPYLLKQTYRPLNEQKMRKTLRLMTNLSKSISFWHFYCNNYKDDCFDIVYKALVQDRESKK